MSIAPRPVPTPPAPWAFLPAHSFDVGNRGLAGLAYHLPGQHILSLRLGIPLPLSFEPARVEGVARVMASMMTEGTASHDALDFTEVVERTGASIAVHAGERGISVDLDVPARNLGAALELMRQCLMEPTFPEAELAREVRQTIAGIESALAHPTHLASTHFAELMFAQSDRLNRPYTGTTETVSAVTRRDVVEYHQALGPSRSTVVIAGDLSDVDAEAMLTAALSEWQDGAHRPEAVEPPGEYAANWSRLVVVDRPGSVQSELRIGCPGPGRTVSGGWAPYPVIAYMLGGATTSRLDAELREKRGYTYGMRATFTPRDKGGLFLASGSVRSDATADAATSALAILDEARGGFTTEEVSAGVDFLVKTAPSRYETADMVADEAISRVLLGSDTDEVTRVLADTATLTSERVNEAYRRYITGRWAVVVLGDAAQFVDALRASGRGEVTVVR